MRSFSANSMNGFLSLSFRFLRKKETQSEWGRECMRDVVRNQRFYLWPLPVKCSFIYWSTNWPPSDKPYGLLINSRRMLWLWLWLGLPCTLISAFSTFRRAYRAPAELWDFNFQTDLFLQTMWRRRRHPSHTHTHIVQNICMIILIVAFNCSCGANRKRLWVDHRALPKIWLWSRAQEVILFIFL